MDKKRILLIYPPSPVMNREDRCQQPTKDLIVIPPLPPTDLMYLAAIAEQQGFDAKIKDYSQGGNYENDLKEFKPDYLVINIATPTLEHDLEAVKKAKDLNPNIITIAKGAAFLTLAEKIISEHDELDFGILGEAEKTLFGAKENTLGNLLYGMKDEKKLVALIIEVTAVNPATNVEEDGFIIFPKVSLGELSDDYATKDADGNEVINAKSLSFSAMALDNSNKTYKLKGFGTTPTTITKEMFNPKNSRSSEDSEEVTKILDDSKA